MEPTILSKQKQSQWNETIQHKQAKPRNHPRNHQNKTANLDQSNKKENQAHVE